MTHSCLPYGYVLTKVSENGDLFFYKGTGTWVENDTGPHFFSADLAIFAGDARKYPQLLAAQTAADELNEYGIDSGNWMACRLSGSLLANAKPSSVTKSCLPDGYILTKVSAAGHQYFYKGSETLIETEPGPNAYVADTSLFAGEAHVYPELSLALSKIGDLNTFGIGGAAWTACRVSEVLPGSNSTS